MADNLMQLPDKTFYRVSVKALIFDSQQRLLVFKNDLNLWELPGGGWEAGESFEACLARELEEEIHGKMSEIGNVGFCYQGKSHKGYPKVSIAVRVSLNDSSDKPTEPDLLESRFVTREEFAVLPFDTGDEALLNFVDKIWHS